MKILKTIVFVASLGIMTAKVSAQEQGHAKMDPAQMAQRQTDRIKQNVTGITPDQESKILAAEKESAQSRQDAWASSNGDKDAARSKMQSIKEALDAKLKGILTADQYTQYQKMEAEQHGHQGGHNWGGNQ